MLISHNDLRRLWYGVVVIVLIATFPQWSQRNAAQSAGYDAPWIHPSINPAVRDQ
jgi:hypothetical protein